MLKILKMVLNRVVFVAAALLVQILVLAVMVIRFNDYFVYFYAICVLLSIGAILYIINNNSNPGYKIAWIVPILMFPIFGGLFYLMFGGCRLSKGTQKKMRMMKEKQILSLKSSQEVEKALEGDNLEAANQSRYLARYAYSPAFWNTYTEYLSPGEKKFSRLLEELRKAERYIFLEYFIIEPGKMWNPILEILKEKAEQGLDVRVIYDDVGCLNTLPYQYDKALEQMGIKCCVFNPFVPVLSARLNNRDHRKIVVIDGHTGFTGGINLADEYINAINKHGHWKDSSILLKGEAVWSLAVMFLTMWNYIRKTDENYNTFRPDERWRKLFRQYSRPEYGYVQPYADSPLDGEPVGETVYLNMISAARKYIYINTPYLILDNEMTTALSNAAKKGVDVRIITPHVADKWFVHAVTRANYDVLVENGVQIYEYLPGFVHAKTFVVDDLYATVGTINLDYRSLYLHFECGVWMYRSNTALSVKEDFLNTLKECQLITAGICHKVPWIVRAVRSILRAFAPLM